MSISSSGFLLDTHIVLWSLFEPARLSKRVRAILMNPSSALHMSEASLWELVDKASKGRLPLAGTSTQPIVEKILALGLTLLPVTQEDIFASVALPLHHGDPFDRMVIAQADRRGLTIVTRDETIPLYGPPVLW